MPRMTPMIAADVAARFAKGQSKRSIAVALGLHRTQVHRVLTQEKRELQPCGTNAAYMRHLRNFEQPCKPCQKAHTEYQRRYNEIRRMLARRQASRLDQCHPSR